MSRAKSLLASLRGNQQSGSATSCVVLTLTAIPMSIWETWLCSTLGVPIPALVANPRSCACQHFDIYGDHLQTCQLQSTAMHTHEWFVYRLSSMLRSVGHRVKTHKVTPAVGHEHGDIEIGRYIVLPCGQDNRLPPRSLLLDFTMTQACRMMGQEETGVLVVCEDAIAFVARSYCILSVLRS